VLLPNSGYPWWQRYQTVSYSLDRSRSGTRDEFVDMVERCARVGVGIYVDAVINHMTARGSGTGSAGSMFTKYEYPPLYTASDFHQPRCAIADEDYASDGERVQRCELLGLSDLATESAAVQDKIADNLSELVRLGVRGFRIDAAKHMAPSDLDAITRKVRAQVGDAAAPYYYFEVFDFGGEAIATANYLPLGAAVGDERATVIEFRYSLVGEYFRAGGGGKLSSLAGFADGDSNFMPSERAIVFINNHDTQRNDGLFYQDGARFDLATIYMLAHPYGYPSLMSSYVFARPSERDRGPPSDKQGNTQAVYQGDAGEPDCVENPEDSTGGWVCEHRRPYVPGMLAFRRATAGAPLERWWDNGENQIAFARGSRGFVVINGESSELTRTFDTGLPPGDYCDVAKGKAKGGACTGEPVSVDESGMARITTGARSASAIHVVAAP
jgi:alpha-amylase